MATRYYELISQGKCPRCSRKHKGQTLCCYFCSKDNTEKLKARREVCMEFGICFRCNEQKEDLSKLCCVSCRKKQTEHMKDIYRSRVERGNCRLCNKQRTTHNQYCDEHIPKTKKVKHGIQTS